MGPYHNTHHLGIQQLRGLIYTLICGYLSSRSEEAPSQPAAIDVCSTWIHRPLLLSSLTFFVVTHNLI